MVCGCCGQRVRTIEEFDKRGVTGQRTRETTMTALDGPKVMETGRLEKLRMTMPDWD